MRAWPDTLKAVIFDHDNTIAHTEALWMQAADRILEDRGITLSEEEYDQLADEILGLSAIVTAQLLVNRYQLPDSVQDIYDEKCRIVRQLYSSDLGYIAGFPEFAALITRNNIQRAIASNSDPDSLSISAERLRLYDIFGDHIYNISHVTRPKPAPDIYQLALKRLGVHPSDAIAIEDSSHGIAAAQAAGIFCVGISKNRTDAAIKNADLRIDSYRALSSYILR